MPPLHAAVGVVACGGLLGHPGPQRLPLRQAEAAEDDGGAPGPAAGAPAGVAGPGAGVGCQPGLLAASAGLHHTRARQHHRGADGDQLYHAATAGLRLGVPQHGAGLSLRLYLAGAQRVGAACAHDGHQPGNPAHACTTHPLRHGRGGQRAAARGAEEARGQRAQGGSRDHGAGVTVCGVLGAAGGGCDLLQPRRRASCRGAAHRLALLRLAVCGVQPHGGGPGARQAEEEDCGNGSGMGRQGQMLTRRSRGGASIRDRHQ